MTEQELYATIAARTGASPGEVAVAVRELFPQAFALAMEKDGGNLVVPHFATFRCRPKGGGGMQFAFRPRLPDELIHAARLRGQRLAVRKTSARMFQTRSTVRLSGAAYVPGPLQPPVGSGPSGVRKPGFLARLFGLGS
jgi:hypothetical protein